MPKELEEKLRRQYGKKGMKGKRLQHAIYGTMTKMGWRKGMSESAMRRKALLG